MSALFAATYPERTSALILYGTLASTIRDASYPWPMDPAERRTVIEAIPEHWGQGTSVDLLRPQPRHRRASGAGQPRLERLGQARARRWRCAG